MRVLKNLFPYFLTSLAVIGVWQFFTLTDTYAWMAEGRELIKAALTTVFIYKTAFWLVISNLIVFVIKSIFKEKYKVAGTATGICFMVYFIVGPLINKKCAYPYYIVFVNQTTVEGALENPIIEAGYYIGPILTDKIKDRKMEMRRYAIDGLGKINYKPATETLKLILYDKTEQDYFRADAYVTLKRFNTRESNGILSDFRKLAVDTIDRKVINLIDNWGTSN